MSLAYTENWDSDTPPALTAGWNTSSAVIVTQATYAYSSPNALSSNASTSGIVVATYGSGDGSGSGSFTVTLYGICSFNSGTPLSPGHYAGIVFRGSASTLNTTNTTWYYAVANHNLDPEDFDYFIFGKMVNGVNTTISSVQLTGSFSTNGWYKIYLSMNGDGTSSNNITLQVTRLSDNYTLNSGGSWASGTNTVVSSTDTSILTGQYYGIYLQSPKANDAVVDDWGINTLGAGSSHIFIPLDGLRITSNLSGGIFG